MKTVEVFRSANSRLKTGREPALAFPLWTQKHLVRTVSQVGGRRYGMGVRVSNTGQKLAGAQRRGGGLQNGRSVHKRQCGGERDVLVRHA